MISWGLNWHQWSKERQAGISLSRSPGTGILNEEIASSLNMLHPSQIFFMLCHPSQIQQSIRIPSCTRQIPQRQKTNIQYKIRDRVKDHEILSRSIPESAPAKQNREDIPEDASATGANTAETSGGCFARR